MMTLIQWFGSTFFKLLISIIQFVKYCSGKILMISTQLHKKKIRLKIITAEATISNLMSQSPIFSLSFEMC